MVRARHSVGFGLEELVGLLLPPRPVMLFPFRQPSLAAGLVSYPEHDFRVAKLKVMSVSRSRLDNRRERLTRFPQPAPYRPALISLLFRHARAHSSTPFAHTFLLVGVCFLRCSKI